MSDPTLGAVCDRPQCRNREIAGGHFLRLRATALALRGPPLQHSIVGYPSSLPLSSGIKNTVAIISRTMIIAPIWNEMKMGLRPIRSASWPKTQMPKAMPRIVIEVHVADLVRLKPWRV